VRAGATIALLDERLVAAGDDAAQVLDAALSELGELARFELLTLYYGQDVDPQEAQALADALAARYAELAVELRAGDQPFYSYIVSVE
jgi:uncharacterized protein